MIKIILLLLFSVNLFSQDLNFLKSQDTIYIILKEIRGNSTQKFETFTLNCYGNDKMNEYNLLNKKGWPIVIRTSNASNSSTKDGNVALKVKRKEFFKKNKNRIIDLKFIEKIVPETLFIYYLDVLHFTKVFYVINENDLKKRKIVLKKALVVAVGYTQM